MIMARRKRKISFTAIKRVPKKVNVKFTTRNGERISFKSVKRVPKKVHVTFYAKQRRKKQK